MTVFTIPSEVSFVDSLAAGLLAETAGDPLALSAMQILLPTRRACRGLAERFGIEHATLQMETLALAESCRLRPAGVV